MYLDGNTPLATFIFKYRDRGPYIYPLCRRLPSTPLTGLLQANGIIPKPPPAKRKTAVFEEVLDLTAGNDVKPEPDSEEIKIIDNATQKRTAGLLSKRSNLSRGAEARPLKRIKREKQFVPTGEVIDLT